MTHTPGWLYKHASVAGAGVSSGVAPGVAFVGPGVAFAGPGVACVGPGVACVGPGVAGVIFVGVEVSCVVLTGGASVLVDDVDEVSIRVTVPPGKGARDKKVKF